MLDRRRFLVGACCALCSTPVMARRRRPRPPRVFCSTPDVIDSDLEGSREDEVNRPTSEGTAGGFPLRPRVRATWKPGTVWRLDQGATPNTGKITLNVKFVNERRGQTA